MQFPFDAKLAQDLSKLKEQITAARQSLYAERRECACDDSGLCAHHAEVAGRLDDAIKQVDLAITIAQDRNR